MAYITLFGVIAAIALTQAEQMCTSLNNINGIIDGKLLPGSTFLNVTATGIMSCSKACLVRTRCASFNFNVQTGACQLNYRSVDPASSELVPVADFVFSSISVWPQRVAGSCADHVCPNNSYCNPINATNHICQISVCLGTPTVENGHLNETPWESPVGTVLPHTCDPVYMASGTVECRSDGTWSAGPFCENIASCSMMKQYQPDSEDGEYWLRLTNFGDYLTQLYCYQMSSSSPQEYLTLHNLNYGFIPNVWNPDCTTESRVGGDCVGIGGETWFNKINVDITTMEVADTDRTFANLSGSPAQMYFGRAYDCYTGHGNGDLRCGVKGYFHIDLGGTGWRVRADQEWVRFGWQGLLHRIDRERNDTVISLYCGGYGGGCIPDGGLFLSPYPEDVTNSPTV